MIHFISGKPRSGKSLFAMRMVAEVLKRGETVITNLPIVRERLASFLPEVCLDTHLRVLSDADAARSFFFFGDWDAELFCWRDLGAEDFAPDRQTRAGMSDSVRSAIPTASGAAKMKRWGRITWVLDEAHLLFNAREFQSCPPGALWFFSQHGKVGADIYLVTQFPGNVDKQLRVLAQDFVVVRNWHRETLRGFRMPWQFRWTLHPEMPGGRQVAVSESGWFVLPAGLADCYKTESGVGIEGAMADKGTAKRGVNMLWLIPLGVAVVFVLNWLTGVGLRAGAKSIAGVGSKASAAMVTVPAPESGVAVGASSAAGVASASRLGAGRDVDAASASRLGAGGDVDAASASKPRLTCLSWVPDVGWCAGLSDGRFYQWGDRGFLGVEAGRAACLDGVWYRLGGSVSEVSVPPSGAYVLPRRRALVP